MEITFEGTSNFVDLPSGKVHYNKAGAGHPVILLHGSGPGATGWSNFAANISVLADHFAVYAIDMPGWGESSPVTFEKRNHVQTLVEFMDALGIDKAAVVGNSMGGATTIRFAAQHPDRMSHLITMGPGSVGVKLFGFGDGPSEGLKILQKGYREPSMETMLELVDIMSFDSGAEREPRARLRVDSLLAHPEHIKNFIDGIGKPAPGNFVSEEELAKFPMPALLMHGRDDRVVHYENTLKLVALIPNSRALLFNKCGHWAQVEHADEFNRVVIDFVKNA